MKPQLELFNNGTQAKLSGSWTVNYLNDLSPQFSIWIRQSAQKITFDASRLTELDSGGALLIENLITNMQRAGKTPSIIGLTPQQQTLLTLIINEEKKVHLPPASPQKSWLYHLGKWFVGKLIVLVNFLSFFGEVSVSVYQNIRHPSRIQWGMIFRMMDETGYRALPIIALLTFLVGIVLTYQIALQLEIYNASIYIVDFTSIVVLREFGPLITAIIAAGRTSTAFTAQIGTMIVNEEVDALKTMGILPIERLVLPKLFALLIVFPLLTAWADLFGILGSMILAEAKVNVSYHTYLQRMQDVVTVRHYWVGLIKAPVFALAIATVGCFQGFSVKATADSVGRKTTQSAVQSIFLIIVIDAVFSIFLSWQGI